jgi:hypothetical protein
VNHHTTLSIHHQPVNNGQPPTAIHVRITLNPCDGLFCRIDRTAGLIRISVSNDQVLMRFNPQAGVAKLMSLRSRRRSGRLPQELLTSNIGDVVDISAGGMRVHCWRLPPKRIRISLQGYELPGPLNGTLAWSRRIGLFRHEVGMHFIDVSPELAEYLSQIALRHRNRRAV